MSKNKDNINVEFCRNVFIDFIGFGIYNVKKRKEGRNEYHKQRVTFKNI